MCLIIPINWKNLLTQHVDHPAYFEPQLTHLKYSKCDKNLDFFLAYLPVLHVDLDNKVINILARLCGQISMNLEVRLLRFREAEEKSHLARMNNIHQPVYLFFPKL